MVMLNTVQDKDPTPTAATMPSAPTTSAPIQAKPVGENPSIQDLINDLVKKNSSASDPATKGAPTGPATPAPPSPQPQAPAGQPKTKPTNPAAPVLGNQGFGPGMEISAPNTFAQVGGQEFNRRGMGGALFSPQSLFAGAGGPQMPTAMGGGGAPALAGGGLTLTPSMVPGGGVPFDGGMAQGPGWPGVQDPRQLSSMINQQMG